MATIQYISKNLNACNQMPHSHHCWELIYIYQGNMSVVYDGGKVECGANQAVLTPPDTSHCNVVSDGVSLIRTFIENSDWKLDAPMLISDLCDNDLGKILKLTCKWFPVTGAEGFSDSVLDSYCNIITRSVELFISSKRCSRPVLEITFDIISNFTNPEYSIDSSFENHELSKDYLRRLFIKEQGFSPIQFLTDIRINHAKKLLKSKTLHGYKINEIAYLCGFDDQLYFSRVFHKIVGKSPREYALENGQNEK
ncbi:MAG: helix-turn-helix domain-containing protein [Christensenellales bacterium]